MFDQFESKTGMMVVICWRLLAQAVTGGRLAAGTKRLVESAAAAAADHWLMIFFGFLPVKNRGSDSNSCYTHEISM